MTQTDDTMRATVLAAIGEIAPEVDPAMIDPGAGLQEECDLDSMDFLRLVELLAERTGVEVPERDYPLIATLDGAVAYLSSHAP